MVNGGDDNGDDNCDDNGDAGGNDDSDDDGADGVVVFICVLCFNYRTNTFKTNKNQLHLIFFLPNSILDIHASELYSEPNVADLKPPVQEDYAEPVDSLQPSEDPEEVLANPIYEGIYSEPLYGIAGTILVGPQVKYFLALYFFRIFLQEGDGEAALYFVNIFTSLLSEGKLNKIERITQHHFPNGCIIYNKLSSAN